MCVHHSGIPNHMTFPKFLILALSSAALSIQPYQQTVQFPPVVVSQQTLEQIILEFVGLIVVYIAARAYAARKTADVQLENAKAISAALLEANERIDRMETTAKEQKAEYQAGIDARQGRIDTLEQALSSANNELNDLRTKVAHLEGKLEGFQQLQQEKSTLENRLEIAINDLQKTLVENSELLKQNEALKMVADSLQKELKTLKTKLDGFTTPR